MGGTQGSGSGALPPVGNFDATENANWSSGDFGEFKGVVRVRVGHGFLGKLGFLSSCDRTTELSSASKYLWDSYGTLMMSGIIDRFLPLFSLIVSEKTTLSSTRLPTQPWLNFYPKIQ